MEQPGVNVAFITGEALWASQGVFVNRLTLNEQNRPHISTVTRLRWV